MSEMAEDIRDIAGPVEILPTPIWVWAVVALAVIALAAGIFWFFWKRRRSKTKKVAPKQAALQALAAMEPQVNTMVPHDFGVEVSDILRTWVSDAHEIPATRQTSQEFLETVRHRAAFAPETQNRIGSFLAVCDVLKFAPEEGSAAECQTVLEQARAIVNEPDLTPALAENRGKGAGK